MGFSIAIVASTIITLASIFTVYKVFLDKPATTQSETVTHQASPSPSAYATTSKRDMTSSPNPPVPKTPATPKPSEKKITLLQNNTALNPSANPSPSTGSSIISGTINLIGSAPSGSSLVIAAKPTGSGEQFKVVIDGITPQNNASWSWNQAQNGVRYDLFAVLKGKSGSVDIDYASSPSSTVKSPYQGQVLIVNLGYALSAPTGSITITCNSQSNNYWTAVVNYPLVQGALMYKLQVGSTSGGSDIADGTKNAQTQDVTIKDSITYYSRYAVSSVSNPTTYQYSAFSTPQAIRCP